MPGCTTCRMQQRHDRYSILKRLPESLHRSALEDFEIKMMQQQLQMAPSKNQMRMAQMMGGRKKMPKMR